MARSSPDTATPRAVLVDLDGPVTRLFPDPAHLDLAADLEEQLAGLTGADASGATDHVQLLRSVARDWPEHLAVLESSATEAELAAAARARPAAGVAAFLDTAKALGYAVGLVSNNASAAVDLAVETCGLSCVVDHVSARRADQVSRLKPAPDLLLDAMEALGVEPADCTFYGDTESDMRAGSAAGVRSVGVTDHSGRATDLLVAGAVGVVRDLGEAIELLEGPERPPEECP